MRHTRLALLLALAALFALPRFASAKTKPTSLTGMGAGPSHPYSRLVVVKTPPTCNCTGANAAVQLCHKEEIEVQVGGSSYTVSTGQSSSSCTTQTLANGECLYYRYIFECKPTFWGWNCELVRTEAKKTTTNCQV